MMHVCVLAYVGMGEKSGQGDFGTREVNSAEQHSPDSVTMRVCVLSLGTTLHDRGASMKTVLMRLLHSSDKDLPCC